MISSILYSKHEIHLPLIRDSVGSALKNNPFCPYVPCHRVIASNLFVGGFHGEWGKDHKTGTRYNEKLQILSQEGVRFNEKGQLISKDDALWHPCS
jgi:methylated-DNA-[protein]-cysteine S-methyltransferase